MTTKPTPTAGAAGTALAALDQVEIFRPGRHMAMSGQVIEFSAADVAAIAASYNPELHEAPHVVGHPKTDGPAYGWVQTLGVNAAGRLVVQASKQVNAEFADMVAAGSFKKRSASFYPPAHPGNPTPGGWYLKHVGWLGATPPAVKGLADVSYGEVEADLVEFSGWEDELNASMWRRMRDWFIGQFGLEAADKVIPAWDVEALQREAMRPEPEMIPTPTHAAYAEGAHAVTTATTAVSDAALAARAAELDARDAALRTQEAAQAALVRQARTAGIAAFADGLVTQGRLLPAERGAIVALAEAMPDSVEVIEFADGDPAKPVKRTPLEVLQGFLKNLPPRVEFGERAKPEAAGASVDLADSASLHRAATEFVDAEAKVGRSVSFPEALETIVSRAGGAPAHKRQS